MDTTFSRDELRALAPADLRGLLELAEGDTEWQKAIALGLSPTNPIDRVAVLKALESAEVSFSPPVGAADSGVRSDRTPVIPEAPAPVDRTPDQDEDALSLPEADPEAAESIAAKMAMSAASGEPFFAGTFALYADPSGAAVVVVQQQDGSVSRSIMPKKIVRLALGLIAGERKGIAGILARKLNRG